MTIDLPPEDASSEAILARWLPAQVAKQESRFDGVSPCLRITLSGPNGGAWDLQLDGGRLHVEAVAGGPGAPRPDDPDVWLRMSEQDFRTVFHGDPDLPDFSLRQFDPSTLWNPGESDLDAFRRLEGRIRFEVAGRRHRRFSLDVAFGRQGMLSGRPKTVVSVDGSTCERLSRGEINPLQALIAGRLRVDGDKSLALQVLTLTASRLRLAECRRM